MTPKEHKLKNDPTGEADALCACGGWRLIAANGPGSETPQQRKHRIDQAFNAHLANPNPGGGETQA